MNAEERDARWMSVAEAADVLGFDPVSLRRALARCARRRDEDPAAEPFDGIVARKVGNTWRVWLAPAWRRPA